MRKTLFGFLFLCAGLAPLHSQTITVSEGILVRDDVAYDILGEWSGQFLLLRDQLATFQVLGFNRKMEKVWEKYLELDSRRPQIIEVVNEKRGFAIAYTFREGSRTNLKIHRYDPAANLTDSLTIASMEEGIVPFSFFSLLSEDRSQLLIYRIQESRDIHAWSIGLDSLKVNWMSVLSPEGMDFERDFQQMLVDNDGNMFCILSKENKKKGGHYYQVLLYGEESGYQLVVHTIYLADRLTYNSLFAIDHLNRQLVAGGLVGDDYLTRATGSFYFRFPLNKPDEGILEFREFDDVFALSMMGKGPSAKNKGVSDVVLREIVLRKDGGVLMIGERERIYQRNLSGGRFDMIGGRFVTDHYHDAIFAISYNPDGSLHWENVFHKKQYSQDDDGIYSSFFLLKTPASLRFLYNDEIRQENTVSEYVASATGQFDRLSVMSTDKQRLRLRFRDAVQISANELIVPSERRNRLKLVRITY